MIAKQIKKEKKYRKHAAYCFSRVGITVC